MKATKTRAKCPECGAEDVAVYLWGRPVFSEELEGKLADGRVVLGGCCIPDAIPDFRCNVCGCEFGDDPRAYESWRQK